MNPPDSEPDEIGYPELLRGLRGAFGVNALLERGNELLSSERYQDAIDAYDKVLSTAPATFGAWNNKGFALKELGKYQEAIECFTKALAINGRDATAWRDKGVALRELGRLADALRSLDTALELDATSPSAWLWKGTVLRQIGKLRDAAQAYTNFLKYAPPGAESDAQSIRDSVLPALERRIREGG